MGTTEHLERKALQAGPVITLSIAIVLLIAYLAVDKVAMADRWTGSDQRAWATDVGDRFLRVEDRIRDVEMKHAELKGKLESVLKNQSDFREALGEIRALLLNHDRDP